MFSNVATPTFCGAGFKLPVQMFFEADTIASLYNRIAAPWHASRNRAWGEFAFLQKQLTTLPVHPHILDAGCGNGRLVNFLETNLQNFNYLGLDISTELLRCARAVHPAREFRVQNLATAWPQDLQHRFDLVACVAALHHLPPEQTAITLTNLRQSLKPGGQLFLTVWNLWQPRYLRFVLQSYLQLHPRACHIPFAKSEKRPVYAYTPRQLRQLLHAAGFAAVQVFPTHGTKKTDLFVAHNLVALATF